MKSDPVVVIVDHRTRPGARPEAQAVWHRLMAPAIRANPGHLDYLYCDDPQDPDVITAVQIYRDAEDAAAFLRTDAYTAYEREVAPLLASAPTVRRLDLGWSRTTSR
jgi:quinol monooxygenase YgiN